MFLCPVVFRQLQYVTECCEGGPEGDGVAALTSEERTTWAKVRLSCTALEAFVKPNCVANDKPLTIPQLSAPLCPPPQAREHLISLDPVNTSILETIQSSLFVVSLDEAKPYATAEDYTPVCTSDPDY